MKNFLFISLVLLVVVAVDATGDAFRLRGWQVPHHVMEIFHVGLWIYIWAFYKFHRDLIWTYILGRIIVFDLVFNLVAGLSIGYVGDSSIYDISVRMFGELVNQHPVHFAFILRFIAFLGWISVVIKNSHVKLRKGNG